MLKITRLSNVLTSSKNNDDNKIIRFSVGSSNSKKLANKLEKLLKSRKMFKSKKLSKS